MNNDIVIIDFRTAGSDKSPHISAIISLQPGKSIVHFHDPAQFSTKFSAWLMQLKKRYNMPNLRGSKYQVIDGILHDGKNGTARVPHPSGFYSVYCL